MINDESSKNQEESKFNDEKDIFSGLDHRDPSGTDRKSRVREEDVNLDELVTRNSERMVKIKELER